MLLKSAILLWCLALGPNSLCQNVNHSIPFNIDLNYPIEIQAPRSNQEIRENNNQSLFGSSVLVTSNGVKQRLLVGASNLASESDSSLYTGGLFQCEIKLAESEHARCAEIDVSTVSSSALVNYQARNRSLIGFNIGYTNSADRVISCAPNWVGETEESEGICFILNRTTGKVESNTKFDGWSRRNLFGFSLSYNQHSQKTIVGIPGWSTATGSLGFLNGYGLASRFDHIRGSNQDNYLSYAVEICSFPGYSNVIAVSSPRTERYGGKVYFYNDKKEIFKLSSDEIGEYFGASLLAIPFSVNTRGKDSLLVGAPMFTSATDLNKREVGQVYYYKNLNPAHKSSQVAIKIRPTNGGQVGGRFGTTMASIDLNKDGYYEAIISAPFENENQGAIYIYYGSNRGLMLHSEKRIGSEDVLKWRPPSRGFGYSLWTQSDLDSNGLNDLVIGSILSDKVIVLRTKPIITMQFEQVYFERINLTDTTHCPTSNNPCFHVDYCININSTQQTLRDTSSILVNFMVTDRKLRVKEKRILVGKSSERLAVKQNQKIICSNFSEEIKRKEELYDIVTPVEFMLSATLLDSPSQGPSQFCPQCPIAAPVMLYKEIDFAHGCFPEKCISSLKLAVQFKYGPNVLKNTDTPIVQGTYDHIEMKITVSNKAKDSIDTLLHIKLKPFRPALKSQDESRCTSSDHQLYQYKCEVNKLLQTNQTEEFKLLFDLSSGELQFNRFNFSFKITSKSDLNSQSVTNYSQTITIIKEAEFNLIESNEVVKEIQTFSDQAPEIRFPIAFLVNKKGPSLVHSAYLQFYLPNFVIQYDQSSRCIQVNEVTSDVDFGLVNDTLQLHCTEHKCSKYECAIGTFHPGDDNINLDLTFTFKASQISSQIQRVNLQIDAQLVIKDEPFFVANKPYATISSVVNFERQVLLLTLLQHKYKRQMMVAGAAVGLLILVATVLILKGFFRRRKREELLQMKEKRKTLWANQTPDGIRDGGGKVERENDEESVEEIKE